jgi:hypothetical protein
LSARLLHFWGIKKSGLLAILSSAESCSVEGAHHVPGHSGSG